MLNRKRFCLLILPFLLTSCGVSETEEDENSKIHDNEETSNVYELENNYAYMYLSNLYKAENTKLRALSQSYGASVNSFTGQLEKISSYKMDGYKEPNYDLFNNVSMKLYCDAGGGYKESVYSSNPGRFIMSGRHLNKWDNVSISYDSIENVRGQTEYVFTKDYFVLSYRAIALQNTTCSLKTVLNLSGYNIEQEEFITILDENKNGFTICTFDENVSLNALNGSLTIEKNNVNIDSKSFNGFSLFFIPVLNGNSSSVERFISYTGSELIAKDIKSQKSLPVSFNYFEGVFEIDATSIEIPEQTNPQGQNNYLRVLINFKNNSGVDFNPIIKVVRKPEANITGTSAVIRNNITLEPTGEHVQISKNWHTASEGTTITEKAYYVESGAWLYGIISPLVKKNSSYVCEYTGVFAKWGETYASSHSQLSLVGFTSSKGNQLWDQSSLGCWGENVTYDPDCCLERSMIDDVRSFLMKDSESDYKEFSWTGNVGGADFLVYDNAKLEKISVSNQKVTYKTVGPNLTQVNYKGLTTDKKIKTDISISLGRTDDIVRNYYNLKYEFLEDVDYQRLAFFKLGSDVYADNDFTKYAYGVSDRIIEKDLNAKTIEIISDTNKIKETIDGEDNFFFTLYNSTNTSESGDLNAILRDSKFNLNGKEYNVAGVNLCKSNNRNKPQASVEFTLPKEFNGTIKKGSTIEAIVEFDVMPSNASNYYGDSQYLKQNTEIFGTADMAKLQATAGNIKAKVTTGSIKNLYPLVIEGASGDVISEFEIEGGLGYIPIAINGVLGNQGYKLQKKVDSQWVDINQSVSGNDYYQVYKDTVKNNYQYAYNVLNTNNLNSLDVNQYRLIKA